MREIKFRAWLANHQEPRMMFFDLREEELNVRYLVDKGSPIMQYTGLKDKNGVEIYEGDIVRWRSHPKPTKISEVVWSNQSFGFYLRWFDDDFEREKNSPSQHRLFALNSIEVIGNIYENPELLEAEL